MSNKLSFLKIFVTTHDHVDSTIYLAYLEATANSARMPVFDRLKNQLETQVGPMRDGIIYSRSKNVQ